jgi:CheY-like chemotaxis protein
MPSPEQRAPVLVVDDEAIIRLDLTSQLTSYGFEVFEAADAASALTLFRAQPDLNAAIVDIHLGGDTNGYELVRAMRAARPMCHVVIMSGAKFAMPPDFDEHVTIESKPCDPGKLATLLRTKLDRG